MYLKQEEFATHKFMETQDGYYFRRYKHHETLVM